MEVVFSKEISFPEKTQIDAKKTATTKLRSNNAYFSYSTICRVKFCKILVCKVLDCDHQDMQ